ncbi:MAG: MFS transporter [Bacteroides graminisolvens]|jgi:MFS transporter, FHS family, L-fucose permease|uniref:Glucose transporter n=1 Tax=Bacteroides graminisolvens DSM 19988 = JCM 15093 TaxID=1121097 RepID=A0A069D3I8_9BACE|nr:MFS transporter [Bacteroides graminisolvens]MBP6061964.1 MFS transporter [Bacteroides sp.]MBP6069568.1 MFS transporter [Bacteroides sp.]MBP6248959.1 MFS transporter [Bacteroides sp.]MBP6980625.1 MFS transporter [Bacteroides sp.]MBP7292948.1 MFS transporter [Bacteroides sp.]
MIQEKKNGNIVAIITMFFIFAMISFVTNLAAPFGTIWKNQYEGANTLGMMGNMMNFLAYLFMGIPAGNMLVKIGYKKTALIAMAVGVLGLFTQYLSSLFGANLDVFTLGGFAIKLNFIIYLLGAFICGFCVCMLNTVVNPMLNLLGGGGNKGNQLIQTGGALNSLSGTLTPLFVGALIGTVTAQTAMTDVAPLLFIAMGVFASAFIIISFIAIPEPHLRKGNVEKEKFAHSPWHFRHTLLGVVGIFIYVGIEIGIPGTLNFYLADSSEKGAGLLVDGAAIGGAISAIYWLLMLVGRSASSAISGKISSRTQLIVVSATAICFVLIAIITPKEVTLSMPGYSVDKGFQMAQVPVSALFLVLCGLCTSVMWGGIFNLAVEGLGKYTAQASGIFMMMVVGGGVLPLVQQFISDAVGYMASYWLIIVLLAYLLFYGLVGCKNVNKDIPVE